MDTTVDGVLGGPAGGPQPGPGSTDALVGRLLDGRYRLDGVLARGGMATVHVATDTRLDRRVAVKTMRPELAADPDFVERFAREARAAAGLSSPEVVAVHDQGTDAETGTAYLVMELVPGGTLRDVVRESAPVPPARALDLLEPVLRALAAAHAAGLVHRDVKPENVLLGDDGRIKVADFGLARAVETSTVTATSGMVLGTVAYLAPEQLEHGRSDPRTDVYAAGTLLWELLTGAPPHASSSPLTVAYRHVHEDVPPPSSVVAGLPAGVDELVVRATRRDPQARPADAGVFLAELRAVRADLPDSPAAATGTTAAPAAPAARRRPRTRRVRPVTALLLALAVTAVLAGGWWALVGRWTSAPAVVGLAEPEALRRLEAAGFTVEQRPAVHSEEVARGTVLDQDPPADGRVVEGGTLALTTSLGPDRRDVPAVLGRTREQAVTALEEQGLRAGAVGSDWSDAPVGTVIGTDPASGTPVPPRTRVRLVLSRGVEMLPVPALQDLSAEAAAEAVREGGFVPKVVEVFSETVDAGVVAAQWPATGTAPRGAEVLVEVSKGPELVTVPDVAGDDRDAAEQRLESLGLDVRVVAIPGPGRARSTDPGAGAQLRKGSTVTLYVF